MVDAEEGPAPQAWPGPAPKELPAAGACCDQLGAAAGGCKPGCELGSTGGLAGPGASAVDALGRRGGPDPPAEGGRLEPLPAENDDAQQGGAVAKGSAVAPEAAEAAEAGGGAATGGGAGAGS